ncbi:MAG: glucose 1-dehydrogenase [Pseudomonadota bacterium]
MLQGKTAIVTGAAQGIGRRLASGLAAAGAKVFVCDILAGDACVSSIREAGGEAHFAKIDITDEAQQAALAEHVRDVFGGLDILVNNAALFGKLPLAAYDEIDIDLWDQVMRVNVRGLWQTVKSVAPLMIERGGGSIVNIATNRVFKGFPNMLHYDASKGAVVAMTKALAVELGEHNIRVNAICPGLTLSENILQKEGAKDRSIAIAQQRAIKRESMPEDMIGATTFLASDLSAFITGQSLVVDGGGIMH